MRHKKAQKRIVDAEPIYKNRMISKFINSLMKDGKKTVAQHIVYGALAIIESKHSLDPMETFEKALNNVGPKIEVRAKRVGGANYQVPSEVRGERKQSLAIRWIIESARKRSNKEFHTFEEKLAQELLDASQNLGDAIKKRDTVLRMAEANRAFSHFRW